MNEIHSKYRKNTGKTLSDQDTTLLGGEELLDYALWLEQELLDILKFNIPDEL